MPELPEVETIVRTLGPQIQGRSIHKVDVILPKAVQAGAQRLPLLKGARIAGVSRRAKLLLISLALAPEKLARIAGEAKARAAGELPPGDLLLVFHLKMTGRFFVHPSGTAPLAHTRLVFDLAEGGRLFFDDMRTFGYCRIMLPSELPAWPFWAALGPEPLGMTAAMLGEHFTRSFAGRRSTVKSALLDQSIVAGIGNIYADESLFKAGLRPDSRAGSVPKERLIALAGALQDVLRLSIEECGSSIRDYRDALGNAGAFQNSFAVYGRKGETCKTCGKALVACKLSGRGTVYCPSCQAAFGCED